MDRVTHPGHWRQKRASRSQLDLYDGTTQVIGLEAMVFVIKYEAMAPVVPIVLSAEWDSQLVLEQAC